jgi:hypothetical protein
MMKVLGVVVIVVALSVGLFMLGVAQAADTGPVKVTLVSAPEYLPAVAALYEEGDGNYIQGGDEYLFEFDQVCDSITVVGFLGTNGEANNRPEYARKLDGTWATTKWPEVLGQFSGSYNPYSVIPAGTIVNKVTHDAPYVAGNDHVYVRGYDVGVQTVSCTYTPPPVCTP